MKKNLKNIDKKEFEALIRIAVNEWPGSERPSWIIMSYKLFTALQKSGYMFWERATPNGVPPLALGIEVVRSYDLQGDIILFA